MLRHFPSSPKCSRLRCDMAPCAGFPARLLRSVTCTLCLAGDACPLKRGWRKVVKNGQGNVSVSTGWLFNFSHEGVMGKTTATGIGSLLHISSYLFEFTASSASQSHFEPCRHPQALADERSDSKGQLHGWFSCLVIS